MSNLQEKINKEYPWYNIQNSISRTDEYKGNEIQFIKRSAFQNGYEQCQKEYEEKLRWISPNIKPKLMDENSMFSVNVSIRVEGGDYEYSGYYNFSTKKWLIYPKEEPFEYELISGWRYFL